ncbi:MAG: hypothetical protein AAGJ35_04610, partial [Myxococcota bacterium]
SPKNKNLKSLRIAGSDITENTVSLLTQAPFFQQLQTLDLSFNPLRCEGANILGDAFASQQIKHLYLAYARNNSCDDEGIGLPFIEALARNEGSSSLELLDLAFADLGPEGLVKIAESPFLKKLKGLDLYMNHVEDEALVQFAASENFANMEFLLLRYNSLSDRSARAIASSEYASNLRFLYLQGNHITDEGAKALLTSPHLQNLECLFLGDNPVSDDIQGEIFEIEQLPKLYHVEIWPSPSFG